MSTDGQPRQIPKVVAEIIRKYQHDPFFRSTFGDPVVFRKFLVWALPAVMVELLDLDRMERQNDSFLDEQLKAHYTDVLYKIPLQGTDESIVVFILVEHKTTSERWTMFQVLRYVVQIWQREFNAAKEKERFADYLLPPVLPIIVYHGEKKFNAAIRLGKLIRPIGGFEKYMLDFEGMLVDLTQIDENGLPEDLELYCVLAVMQAVFREDVADRMLRIYRKLRPKFHDGFYRDRWTNLFYYLLTSSKYLTQKKFDEAKTQMSDTDENLTISPWLAETIFNAQAEGEAKGWAEGKTEGKTEGKAEGKAEGEAKVIIRILTRRFQTVSPSIREALLALANVEKTGRTSLTAVVKPVFFRSLIRYVQSVFMSQPTNCRGGFIFSAFWSIKQSARR